MAMKTVPCLSEEPPQYTKSKGHTRITLEQQFKGGLRWPHHQKCFPHKTPQNPKKLTKHQQPNTNKNLSTNPTIFQCNKVNQNTTPPIQHPISLTNLTIPSCSNQPWDPEPPRYPRNLPVTARSTRPKSVTPHLNDQATKVPGWRHVVFFGGELSSFWVKERNNQTYEYGWWEKKPTPLGMPQKGVDTGRKPTFGAF